jgi:hypothetical protein
MASILERARSSAHAESMASRPFSNSETNNRSFVGPPLLVADSLQNSQFHSLLASLLAVVASWKLIERGFALFHASRGPWYGEPFMFELGLSLKPAKLVSIAMHKGSKQRSTVS